MRKIDIEIDGYSNVIMIFIFNVVGISQLFLYVNKKIIIGDDIKFMEGKLIRYIQQNFIF